MNNRAHDNHHNNAYLKTTMKYCCFLLTLITISACRDKYESPVTTSAPGCLVVEHLINMGTGPTTVTLLRVCVLDEPVTSFVKTASVQVESEDNNVYAVTEKANDLYTADELTLNSNLTYQNRNTDALSIWAGNSYAGYLLH